MVEPPKKARQIDGGRVLVTGAAGYLGTHTVAALVAAGHDVVGVDNFSRSSPRMVDALAQLVGRRIPVIYCDCRNLDAMRAILERHQVAAVVHLAGYKSVLESWQRPADYFDNNVGAAGALMQAMADVGVRRLVFSSSCTVYGQPAVLPVDESAPRNPISPYGKTKAVAEELIECLTATDDRWSAVSLRYFNPIGADPSGLIGEDPTGTPTTLLPRLLAVAGGRMPALGVTGGDHPTPDGTCVRDYIHVCDLAEAHVKALTRLDAGHQVVDIARGVGTSVLEMIAACERVLNVNIPFTMQPARPGDAAAIYARGFRARDLLGWTPSRDLDDMIRDHWRWTTRHGGFGEEAEDLVA